jgi:Uma2 family endonuclease
MSAVLETLPQTESLTPIAGNYPTRLFTAAEYQTLADMGVLGEDERVELIEGRIVRMAAKNMNHAIATSRSNRCFQRLLGDQVLVRVQDPILLNNYSEPEPDVVLVRPPDERYLANHPTPEDIFLVMEIAESSLAYDRDVKCPLFAQNGILQFCLLNLHTRELEDYREPSPNGYRSKQTYIAEQSFTLVAFPDLSLQVSDLLPPLPKDSGATNGKQRKQ